MSIGIVLGMGSGAIQTSETIPTWLTYITIALVATAGTAFAMWIGERITEKGIGNGISMLIFVGIASRLLPTVINFFTQVFNGAITFWLIPVAVVLVAVLVGCLTLVDLGERRVPFSTPSAWWDARCMVASPPTSPCASTRTV